MSARSTISVLALGTSSPLSMITVQTSTSASRFQNLHHLLLEQVLVHLAVRDDDARFGKLLLQPRRLPVDRGDPVVDPEHLALAQQLALHGAHREALVVAADVGEHRLAVLGRGVDRAHLADARERHLQRARDRRRRHREHVDAGAELLQPLLVRDAEPLLLVDDQQPEVLERHVLAEQPVRADHHVDLARLHVLDDLLLLGGPTKRLSIFTVTGNGANRSVNVMKCCSASSVVGTSTATCLPSITALNAARSGDLGLAEPHVAADQAVHRLDQLHVALDLVDRRDLVARLLVRERVLELLLPWRVGAERVAGHRHAHRVEAHQLARHVADGAFDLGGRARPVAPAHAVQPWCVAADVLRDHADLVATARRACRPARTPGPGSRARRPPARGG